MSAKMNSEKQRTVFVCACPTRCLVCVVASLFSLAIWAGNPYAASGGKSNSFVSQAYQGTMKLLGMDKSKPPESSWGNGPAFDMDNGKVVDGIQNLPGYKASEKAREEDCGADVQGQLKTRVDIEDHDADPSFNPSVDAWRSDEDIAKAAIFYAGGKDWKDYVKILDARIGYLEQVLTDGKGDASFANLQTEEMIKIDVRIYKTVSNAEGWSRKDSARVLKKMIEDYDIKDKLRRLLNLLEEVEKRGIWSKRVGGEFSDSSPTEKPMRDKQQGERSDNHSCSCKNPSPNVTVGGRTGWASCDKCNKLIGAVTVDKNGEVRVAGRNQVANEMVKDMVKEMLAKDKK